MGQEKKTRETTTEIVESDSKRKKYKVVKAIMASAQSPIWWNEKGKLVKQEMKVIPAGAKIEIDPNEVSKAVLDKWFSLECLE